MLKDKTSFLLIERLIKQHIRKSIKADPNSAQVLGEKSKAKTNKNYIEKKKGVGERPAYFYQVFTTKSHQVSAHFHILRSKRPILEHI